jgi:hypothetical protein
MLIAYFMTFAGTLMQITEPIANILSEVIKRQQEMLQMIQSCNCAKPVVPSMPFGQGSSDMGPYF